MRTCRAINCDASNPLLTNSLSTTSPNFPYTTKEEKKAHVIGACACACPYATFHVCPLAKGIEVSLL
jgi:hypothetical protein